MSTKRENIAAPVTSAAAHVLRPVPQKTVKPSVQWSRLTINPTMEVDADDLVEALQQVWPTVELMRDLEVVERMDELLQNIRVPSPDGFRKWPRKDSSN